MRAFGGTNNGGTKHQPIEGALVLAINLARAHKTRPQLAMEPSALQAAI